MQVNMNKTHAQKLHFTCTYNDLQDVHYNHNIFDVSLHEVQCWQHVMIMSLAHLMGFPVTWLRFFGMKTQ